MLLSGQCLQSVLSLSGACCKAMCMHRAIKQQDFVHFCIVVLSTVVLSIVSLHGVSSLRMQQPAVLCVACTGYSPRVTT